MTDNFLYEVLWVNESGDLTGFIVSDYETACAKACIFNGKLYTYSGDPEYGMTRDYIPITNEKKEEVWLSYLKNKNVKDDGIAKITFRVTATNGLEDYYEYIKYYDSFDEAYSDYKQKNEDYKSAILIRKIEYENGDVVFSHYGD